LKNKLKRRRHCSHSSKNTPHSRVNW